MKSQRGSRANLVFVLVIVGIGIAAAILRQRTPDFMGEDVFYADAARSLLHGFYGVNGTPETTQPPGLSAILAILIGLFGYSYAVCVTAMAMFETLGFLAAFALLRRRLGTAIAGAICIFLMTSPVAFGWATRFVYACFPYFFTTMFALLCAEEQEKAQTSRSRALWGVALALAVAASLLIATGTIALLGAMVMVVFATALKDRQRARAQLLRFLPALVLGIVVQAIWMHRRPAPLDWSLPGYPASYLQQLEVKEGNHPEEGLATWKDISARTAKNVLAESDILTELVFRHGVNERRVSIVLIPVLLIAGGWAYALWMSGGTDLIAWYFGGYTLIYLLWPFTMELRFVLPVAPLACLYGWHGFKGLLAVGGSATGQDSLLSGSLSRQPRWTQYLSGALAAALVLIGITVDKRIARENLDITEPGAAETTGPSELLPVDVDAGLWLRSHTSNQAIVMARSWPTVSHYAERKVIWFPPISDPHKLLDGMLRHRVDYVVVITHESPYYLPDDDYCFDHLLANHSHEFHLVLQRPNLRIYRFDASE